MKERLKVKRPIQDVALELTQDFAFGRGASLVFRSPSDDPTRTRSLVRVGLEETDIAPRTLLHAIVHSAGSTATWAPASSQTG
jgi:hypothetical protein